MSQKKLMLRGGAHYFMPAIEAAHKLGVEVIICLTTMDMDSRYMKNERIKS